MKYQVKLLALAVALLCLSGPAFADQIFIQQSGTSPAGGDPNLITDTSSFVVGVAGSATGQDPLLIIVGVYNGMGTPTISFSGGVSTATIGTYGLTANTAVPFTAASVGSAFDQLGLASGGSESFDNWACGPNGCPGTGGDIGLGLPKPTSFTLYAFALDTSLTGTITIDVSGAARGSYIIAYDCKDGTGSSTGCAKPGDIMQTVYTNSGLVNVPEPASLLLFGSGLLGLALKRRRLG